MWVVFDSPLVEEDASTSSISYFREANLDLAAKTFGDMIATSFHYESDPDMVSDTPPLPHDIQALLNWFVASPDRPQMLRYDTPEWSHVIMRTAQSKPGWVAR